jgi:hypothetical protein
MSALGHKRTFALARIWPANTAGFFLLLTSKIKLELVVLPAPPLDEAALRHVRQARKSAGARHEVPRHLASRPRPEARSIVRQHATGRDLSRHALTSPVVFVAVIARHPALVPARRSRVNAYRSISYSRSVSWLENLAQYSASRSRLRYARMRCLSAFFRSRLPASKIRHAMSGSLRSCGC